MRLRQIYPALSLLAVLILAGCSLSFEGVQTEMPQDGGPLPTLAPVSSPVEGDTFVTIIVPVAPTSGAPATVDPAGFTVSGQQRGSFENNVIVEALDAEGNVLEQAVTTASGDLGQVGDWQVTLAPTVLAGTPGRIHAYFTSARDGSVVAEVYRDVVYGGDASTSG